MALLMVSKPFIKSLRMKPIDVIPWLLLSRHHEVDICGSSFEWNILTAIGWIGVNVATCIHGPEMINSNAFGNPLPF